MVLTEQRPVGSAYHSASGDGGDKKERDSESATVGLCFDGITVVLIRYSRQILTLR